MVRLVLISILCLMIALGARIATAARVEAGPSVRKGAEASAVTLLVRRAETGDADAAYRLAEAYRDGRNLTVDADRALHWLRRAARAGHGLAAFRLGEELDRTTSKRADSAARAIEARYWFARAARAGIAVAMTRLADMVAAGRGGPRDDAAALRLYLQAQDRDGRAALELGNRYRTGLGVDGDACLAKAWYAQAARMGEASARPLLESLALASLEAASGCGSEASDLDRALRRIKGPGGAFYSGAFYSGAFYSGAWRGLR